MQLDSIDYATIAIYLLGVLALGAWLSRSVRTEKDFFLAGKSLPFWAVGMSIVVSDIGALDFVSLSGQGYRYGLVAANMDWIGTMPAIILAAFVFVPYYWRAGVYSVPEFLGLRYNHSVRFLVSIVWTLVLVANLGLVFWATAQMFDVVIGPEAWGDDVTQSTRFAVYIWATALFTGFYTVSGGLAAVVYTDVIQLVIMFVGALLVIGIGLGEVGGLGGLSDRLEALGKTEHLTLFLPHDTTTPYPWHGVLLGLAFVLAPAYFIGNQAIVQRTLGARDEWAAKAGTLFGGFLKFCIPVLVVLPGLIAVVLYPELEDGDLAFGTLVRDLLPVGLRGLVFAAFLAALMSTVDSVLASTATLVTHDLWIGLHDAGYLAGRPQDRTVLRVGRVVTIALVVGGAASSGLSERFDGVYTAIQTVFSVVQGPMLAILLGGVFTYRATSAGALATIVTGGGTALALSLWQKSVPEGEPAPFNAAEPFFMIAAISFAVSITTLLIVSSLTRPRPASELRGLVFRRGLLDDEAEDALRERSGLGDGAGRDDRSNDETGGPSR